MSTPQLAVVTEAIETSTFATSNTSSRILTISPSVSRAIGLISRIQALAKSSSVPLEKTTDGSIASANDKKDVLSPDLVKIPWTIENKYYSADVHFAAHPTRGLAPYLLQNIPAVIFVWGDGEAYKHHIERLSHDLGGYEPEVSLAVRVKLDGPPVEPVEEGEEEDNATIDGFLSNFGFEYVDATQEVVTRGEERQYAEESDDGIPSLPRVVDALGTIMWPSMKARERGTKGGSVPMQRDPSLIEWGVGESRDDSLSLVDDLVGNSGSQRGKRLQSEVEELTRWLEREESENDREDPWKMAASSSTIVSSPTEGEGFGSVTDSVHREQAEELSSHAQVGFDDDFTVFVSAPIVDGEESGQSTPVEDEIEEPGMLKPLGGLSLYNSLGSVSDFGSEGGRDTVNVISDDEDDGLPTREEIVETSLKIFGKNMKGSSGKPTEDLLLDGTRLNEVEDNEFDMVGFDLPKVLGALQRMKEEIAGMDNEEERRKAAARVALGVVYGIEVEGEMN